MSRRPQGVRHPSSKLDERMAAAICASPLSSRQAALAWDISDGLVRRLRRRGRWGSWKAVDAHGHA